MKRVLLITLFVTFMVVCFAQKPYKVVFYNFENLFDTINDPSNKGDDEFTPEGRKKWNSIKYNKKLKNLERVLFEIAAEDKDYPAVIGISEIENRTVLEDVAAMPKLAPAAYRILHYDSPDGRGIDVAFFYRPDIFHFEGSAMLPFRLESDPEWRARDFVTMWGTIEGEPFFFINNHWPSRVGGQQASAHLRMAAAVQSREIIDSVMQANPETKIILLGDLNDDAGDDSIIEGLGTEGDIDDLDSDDMYNPFIEVHKAGYGTLAYRDNWNLFDNIIVSENLATGSTGKLKLQKVKGTKFRGGIFKRPYMFQKEGQFKGYPLRTFVGNDFKNGFSDHLPVYIYISK